MLLLAFRSFFFIAVILGYSTGIWRLINDYFRREFQSYLVEESQANKYLLRDPPKSAPDRNPAGPPEVPDNQLPAPNVDQLFGDVKHRNDHQQVTDSIMVLFETRPSVATTAAPGTDVKAYTNEQEAETHRPGERTVLAAAEVTDIRLQDEGHVSTREPNEGKGDGEAEDKWISYWSKRGGDRKRDGADDGPADDNSANAYCTIGGETFAGAVTRIAQRIAADGDGFGCA
ncbi:uncharacterized protein LOC128306574 [Anopheles moucheti]|uniref:uncharacterized protein LOC128306574 n=1 Tax=Anopheles moucheti TaxID=186751 RepID=UPI0022F0B468|nr:uncharacterized protein LOC128306574 [Anopheles moucheti]